ncbi:MAG: 3-phosphoshikimate 1-carboxyvinyltransferase [Gammaproteobacteria bacterium]
MFGKGFKGMSKPKGDLYFGNSGTGIRLTAGVLAWQSFDSELRGDSSLSTRPMKRISEPLSSMGAKLLLSPENTPPIKISGNTELSAISYEMPIASAQVKSAILFAALNVKGVTKITEPLITRNHTELMFKQIGVDIQVNNNEILLSGQNDFEGFEIDIPGDFSSAAFLIVGALISPNSSILIKDVGLNPSRTALIEVLLSMNADIEIQNHRKFGEEEVGDLKVNYSELVSCKVDAEVIPNLIDELPILFIASLFAEGESKFFGIEELKHKESDRLVAMQSGLKNLGIDTQYNNDTFSIDGKGSNFLLQEGQIDSFEDHRIAMSFIIAGLRAKKQIQIMNSNCINTSFPEFISQLDSLGAILNESK